MPRRIDGRDPEAARSALYGPEGQLEPDLKEYRKTATVLATQIEDDVIILTPEGHMEAHEGDYLVADKEITHLWPVRREVFEATYVEVAGEPDAPVS